MRTARPLLLLALVLSAAILPGAATTRATELATDESAFAAAFPGAKAERHSTALTDAEVARVKELDGEIAPSRVITWKDATRDGALVGRAWLDTHVVRTLSETILVSIDAAGRVTRVDVLTFREPREYLPPVRWLAQFNGKPLSEHLAVKRDIAALGGATLSGRAITHAVRRCLAFDAIVRARAPVTVTVTPSAPAPTKP